MFILVRKNSFFIFDCFLLLCYGLLSGLLLSLNNNDNNNNNNNNNNNDDDDDDDDDNNNNNNSNNSCHSWQFGSSFIYTSTKEI